MTAAAPLPLFERPLAVGDPVRSKRGRAGEVVALVDAKPYGYPGRSLAMVRRTDGRIVPAWPDEIERIEQPIEQPAAIRISRPGVYTLPADVYHADPTPEPSLSSTLARAIITRSPMHAAAMSPRLTRHPDEQHGEALDRGTAAHELLFGYDEGRVEIVHAPDWRGKKARAARARIRAQGRAPILAHELAKLVAMTDAARRQIKASRIPDAFDPAAGEPERSLFWHDAGIWQRCRHDWTRHDRRLVLDYKTTALSLPDWTRHHFKQAALAVQAAHYRAGHRAIFGVDPRFAFIVQEVVEPFALAVVEVPRRVLDEGERQLAKARAAWRHGLATGDWPGYDADRLSVEPPRRPARRPASQRR